MQFVGVPHVSIDDLQYVIFICHIFFLLLVIYLRRYCLLWFSETDFAVHVMVTIEQYNNGGKKTASRCIPHTAG